MTLGLNCPEFPESCRPLQFVRFVDVFQMLADRTYINGKQFRQQLLRQPDGFLLVARLDTLLTCLASENQKLGSAVADEFGARAHLSHLHTRTEF